MAEKKIKLQKLKMNPKNPRMISEVKLEKLKDSLLVFPEMLELRPLVVDGVVVLGGNMRTKALKEIAKMPIDYIQERLQQTKTYQRKSEQEQKELIAYWTEWLKKKDVTVMDADTLTDAEKDEFILKDNASFGEWDDDELKMKWDVDLLEEWGVEVWAEDEVTINSNLPEELAGLDINPDDLPDIVGDDETPFQRILITYKPEEADELAALLGLAKIDKVVYEFGKELK